ncbi:MAG: EAL domain-containing protein [Pseudomonadota bacterium]
MKAHNAAVARPDTELTGSVRGEQVRFVYAQPVLRVALSCLGAGVLAWTLHPFVDPRTLTLWLVGFAVVTAIRIGVLATYRAAHHPEVRPNFWYRLYVGVSLLTGLAWGATGYVFPVPDQPEVTVALALALGGLAAGAMATLSPMIHAYFMHALPILLPGIIWLFLHRDNDFYLLMAMVGSAYGVLLLMAAKHFERHLREAFFLGMRNRKLVDELSDANAQLEAEVLERRHAEGALSQSEGRIKDFLDTAADWFFETDADLRVTYISGRHQEISGWPASSILGRTAHELYGGSIEDPDKIRDHLADLEAHHPYKIELISASPDGALHVYHYAGKPIFDGENRFLGYRGTGRDVTEAHRMSEQLTYQANHDALTGLINRKVFEQRVERVLRTARSDDSTHALCYLDLDQFKVINDTSGHLAGDELLRQLGKFLPQYIRKRDTLARLGGDEFGVLMEHCSLEQAERVANTLCHAIEEFRFLWEDRSFRIGVSIGLVPVTAASDGLAEVLSAADTACYVAKDSGRHRVHVYRPDDAELAKRHGELRWVVRLNRALEEDRFRLAYQPIAPINAAGEQLPLQFSPARPSRPDADLHVELLVRLEEDDGKWVPPGAFLPAAERFHMAARLDRWVVSTALTWFARHPEVLDRLRLCAINLSGHSLGDDTFLGYIMETLDASDVPPNKICFEITETAAVANLTSATMVVRTLSARGCQFALDDFGSGLSSFAYLKALPVDYLKIDGQFVKDIAEDDIDLAMVRSINDIGQVMGKRTIAEFVEDDEVLNRLREIGVDYAQGFRIGEPRPLEELLGGTSISRMESI